MELVVDIHYGVDKLGCAGGGGGADQETCGTVQYTGTLFSSCECNGLAGADPGDARPKRGPQQLTPNYSDPTVPWDSVKLDDTEGFSGCFKQNC